MDFSHITFQLCRAVEIHSIRRRALCDLLDIHEVDRGACYFPRMVRPQRSEPVYERNAPAQEIVKIKAATIGHAQFTRVTGMRRFSFEQDMLSDCAGGRRWNECQTGADDFL